MGAAGRSASIAPSIEDLFRAHWGLVIGYLVRRTGDPSLAEELTQETFFRATRAFLGWRGGSPASWLLAIARNVLTDEARRGRRLVPLEQITEPGSSSVEHAVGVRDMVSRLPPSQRALLELIYDAGFTHAEIAAMTGTTPGAVKTAAYRARQAVQALHEQE